MYRSCLRLSTRPARRSTSRWCESVGPGTSTASWISLTETSRLARARKKKTCSRVKWARALRSSTWLSLASSLASGSVGAPSSQASSRSRSSGRLRRRWSDGSPVSAGRSPSNHAEMPKRLFDRLTLFGRARIDVTIPTGPVRPTQRRYAVNLLDMSDPPRFRDEAVVALHELMNLGVRGHLHALHDRTLLHERTYGAGVTDLA